MKTTNTSKEQHIDWLFGMNPRSIENQESQGQKELVDSDQLPAKLNSYAKESPIEQYKKMGIEVIGQSEGDNLFLNVKLPNGWKKEPTDHSMWNKLVDDNGRTRAMFFYKAAFYDRDSFINFETRYKIESVFPDNDSCGYVVKDGDDILFDAGIVDKKNNEDYYEKQGKLRNDCINWLNTNFPNWQDIDAYWD